MLSINAGTDITKLAKTARSGDPTALRPLFAHVVGLGGLGLNQDVLLGMLQLPPVQKQAFSAMAACYQDLESPVMSGLVKQLPERDGEYYALAREIVLDGGGIPAFDELASRLIARGDRMYMSYARHAAEELLSDGELRALRGIGALALAFRDAMSLGELALAAAQAEFWVRGSGGPMLPLIEAWAAQFPRGEGLQFAKCQYALACRDEAKAGRMAVELLALDPGHAVAFTIAKDVKALRGFRLRMTEARVDEWWKLALTYNFPKWMRS